MEQTLYLMRSNDGITFIEITEASNLTRLTTNSYTNNIYTKQVLNNLTPFLYIGFCVNKLTGIQGELLNFQELQLFGKENNNFQSDWNSTIINKPDLSVYATNTNLNNLSSRSSQARRG